MDNGFISADSVNLAHEVWHGRNVLNDMIGVDDFELIVLKRPWGVIKITEDIYLGIGITVDSQGPILFVGAASYVDLPETGRFFSRSTFNFLHLHRQVLLLGDCKRSQRP